MCLFILTFITHGQTWHIEFMLLWSLFLFSSFLYYLVLSVSSRLAHEQTMNGEMSKCFSPTRSGALPASSDDGRQSRKTLQMKQPFSSFHTHTCAHTHILTLPQTHTQTNTTQQIHTKHIRHDHSVFHIPCTTHPVLSAILSEIFVLYCYISWETKRSLLMRGRTSKVSVGGVRLRPYQAPSLWVSHMTRGDGECSLVPCLAVPARSSIQLSCLLLFFVFLRRIKYITV